MADYWCETCRGKSIGKKITSVFSHLKYTHNINVITRAMYFRRERVGHREGNDFKHDYFCSVCGELLGHDVFRGSDWACVSRVSRQHIKTHMKQHPKFKCDGCFFETVRDLLNYIDEQHGIHIGFVKGLTKRKVFLDGITK